ncbi:MAG: SDR family oxidoreductase [Gammaproteobacteria bacterium]|nr:SDR family oxidoreductase [Gammaproteobacteria bacterium]
MRVLVTGHCGYIGSVLVPTLLYERHEVVGLDSDLFERCTFTGTLADVPHVKKDIRDVNRTDLVGFDAIIHLAGLSNDPLGDYKPSLTEEINEKASIRLATLAKEVGVHRFLFASSCSNYGAAGSDFLTETAPFNPVTPYGLSKVNVEKAVSKLADNTFSPTFLRASTAYGLSPRLRFDLVLNNLIAWAFTSGRVYMKSDGTPWRPIVHVEDIARAYVSILNAPRELIHNEAFNIGATSENYQIRDLAEIVKDIVPNCRIEYAPDASPDLRCYRVDCTKMAKTIHGFKPQWTARRGAEQLYMAYNKVGLTIEDFEGEKFKRISHVTKLIADGLLDDSLRPRSAQKTAAMA